MVNVRIKWKRKWKMKWKLWLYRVEEPTALSFHLRLHQELGDRLNKARAMRAAGRCQLARTPT